MSTTLTSLGQVNSTSYQDVPGLYAGLTRFPGETTAAFKQRLQTNAMNLKQHNYVGTVENINTHLGLYLFPAIQLTSTYTDATFSYSFGSISISSSEESIQVPTITIAPDGVWIWEMLSDVVAGINTSNGYTATLLSADGPACQIAKQQNTGWIVNESVEAQVYQLDFSNYVAGTAAFNQTVNSFSINNNILTLDQEYPGLAISYQYMQWPYTITGSPASVISLVDPDVQNYMIYNGDLVYQVQEVIQTLMQVDGSYWGE
jgi:hypothetical protein